MSEAMRRDELAANLAAVRSRVDAAAAAAGRDAAGIRLVVVTKFFPAADVRTLAGLGVAEVAESRHQEASQKTAELADLELVWHFVGNLQSNKAAAVAGYADVVQSVDRRKLLAPLSRGAHERGRPLEVTVQVQLDAEPDAARGGARPEEVAALADAVAATEGLQLRGLMAVAPLGEPPAPAFDRLARLAARLREDHPEATWISAGMSGDLEQAVSAGATLLRVGSAVLGPRPSAR
ncbi:YggS family pyridoxal phosphate-dependent enzyme [Nocardioides mangrovicus]|uniref:Pyridoxal phosphate homeostasis protein n=1 Tax=Nocardioides mangrovicus TaxID=2478913 RepID=A0A3L8P1X9_9ACTN|nr:YggS family pyridoxal phosphate-dependent enzyme [Nocardioides mangrovicus]RLV48967.1 YggS family pyridoxal phosphate-dependent enzyme [Nocardioides mangrovicus]